MLVCLTKTGKVIQVTAEQAARLVAGGRARYVIETAVVHPPERAVVDREKR